MVGAGPALFPRWVRGQPPGVVEDLELAAPDVADERDPGFLRQRDRELRRARARGRDPHTEPRALHEHLARDAPASEDRLAPRRAVLQESLTRDAVHGVMPADVLDEDLEPVRAEEAGGVSAAVLAVAARALEERIHPLHELLRSRRHAAFHRHHVEREGDAAAAARGEDALAVVRHGARGRCEAHLHDRLLVADLHERDVVRGLDDVLEPQEAERERDDPRRGARDRRELRAIHDERDGALRRRGAAGLRVLPVAVQPRRLRPRDAADLLFVSRQRAHRAFAMPAWMTAASMPRISRCRMTPSGPMKNVVGRLPTPYRVAIFFPASRSGSPFSMRYEAMKASVLAALSSRSSASTASRGSAWAARSSAGISSRQGSHQVAQKFTTTVRPRRSESRCVFPAGVVHSKSGACPPMRGESAGSSIARSTTPARVGTSCGPVLHGRTGHASATIEAAAIPRRRRFAASPGFRARAKVTAAGLNRAAAGS